MRVTFHGVELVIEADTPAQAYDYLCDVLEPLAASGKLEYGTSTYSVSLDPNEVRETYELWPDNRDQLELPVEPEGPTLVFRARWRRLGGHVHVLLFQATHPAHTWQLNGELAFAVAEWPQFERRLVKAGFEIIPEFELVPEMPDAQPPSKG